MRISDVHRPLGAALIGAAIAVLGTAGTRAVAFELSQSQNAPALAAPKYGSIREALRAGISGLSTGDTESAMRALQFAASNGNIAAQWKLGRMHADGIGGVRNDFAAFKYFSDIADKHADESPDSPHARVVAQAFVAVGTYYLEGIANSPVKRDRARAREMFHYAATFFGDADAQYSLGRVYLDGTGVPRSPAVAARWFNLAAEKGHVPAQAALGQIIFNGDGVPRQAARGLMWILLAEDKADTLRQAWIFELSERAKARASEDERQLASNMAKRVAGGLRNP